jgi:tripartite-type tricarboxylate transporter receptor subunit TctC
MKELPVTLALAATSALIDGAAAQSWPTRPVTMVVTFAAGSSDDVLARILSPRLSELLGQQVIIENVGGAGGMTGTSRAAWNGFFLPKGTPAAIVQKPHDASVAAMKTPPVQERLQDIGATIVAPERRSPNYLQRFVESEIKKWAGPIRASGVSMD